MTSPRDPSSPRIDVLDAPGFEAAVDGLADLLVDAVDSGASVSFLAGLDTETARSWWRGRLPDVEAGHIVPFVAQTGDRVVGVVLLLPSQSQNGVHRAEIAKLIVHRDARGRGIATSLLAAAEEHARVASRWLLILDTQTGSDAEYLYRARGWHQAGEIPAFASRPDGTLAAATFFSKDLRAVAAD